MGKHEVELQGMQRVALEAASPMVLANRDGPTRLLMYAPGRVGEWREEKGMTRRDLAGALGLAPAPSRGRVLTRA